MRSELTCCSALECDGWGVRRGMAGCQGVAVGEACDGRDYVSLRESV